MGFRTGAYAKVWEIKKGNGNYTDIRISTSKKNKRTEEYETDFSGYVRLIGTAHQNANTIKEKDTIKIGDCETTNSYDKEKKVTYTNHAIFTFEGVVNDNSAQNSKNTETPAVDDEELPF